MTPDLNRTARLNLVLWLAVGCIGMVMIGWYLTRPASGGTSLNPSGNTVWITRLEGRIEELESRVMDRTPTPNIMVPERR